MKVGIIGYGFVGKSIANGFKPNVEVYKVDPKLSTDISDLKIFNPDVIFICVPTPMNNDSTQDISAVMQTIKDIKKYNFKSLIVLKSTVLPNYLEDIKSYIPNIVFNPEFLREKFAKQDFINANLIVFGGEKTYCQQLAKIYSKYTKCKNKEYIFTDLIAASLIKYTINSFLATKVTFFNELNSLFNETGTKSSWKEFVNAITKDPRIGNSHMSVPGNDGRLGYGGACFPKDTYALLEYSKNLDSHLELLKSSIMINNKIRASYNNETERELEQNINFKGENK
tara:strand:+ start:961 stop:1809 length:849 start_codon:yes stop_codon:yes gene_type:complete